MRKKAKIVLGILIGLVVANIAVFTFLFIGTRKDQIQTQVVSQKKADKELEEKEKAEKEAIDIKKGLSKMTLGRVVSIDRDGKSFTIDIDPFGMQKRYVIHTSNGTDFHLQKIEPQIVPEETEEGRGDRLAGNGVIDEEEEVFEEDDQERKLSDADFGTLEEGANAEVHFAQRIDLDKVKKLVAEEVIVVK